MQLDVRHGVLDVPEPLADGAAPPEPRWQWRVLSRGSAWRPKLARFLVGAPEPAVADTYVLSARSPNSVKLHEHHIDVKEVDRTAPDGLELWRPTRRLQCPLGVRQLADLFAVWKLDDDAPTRPCWSVRQFERDIVDPRPELLLLPVVKHSTALDVAGCEGEYVDLLVMGEHRESVALMDADDSRVRAAITMLGLSRQANTGYPVALSEMVGLAAYR